MKAIASQLNQSGLNLDDDSVRMLQAASRGDWKPNEQFVLIKIPEIQSPSNNESEQTTKGKMPSPIGESLLIGNREYPVGGASAELAPPPVGAPSLPESNPQSPARDSSAGLAPQVSETADSTRETRSLPPMDATIRQNSRISAPIRVCAQRWSWLPE
jgi:hypothetical protein